MPFYVRNKQTGAEDLVDDEYDVKSGENVAVRELSKDPAFEVGYYVVGNRKSTSPGERVWVPANELGEALKSNQFDTEELASARKSRRELISKSTSFAKGAEQGLLFNGADEARGTVAGVKSALKGKGFKEGFDRGTNEAREMYEDAQEANPWSYGAGEVVAGTAVPIPGAGLIKGASTAAKVGRAAVSGAIGGGASSLGAAEGSLSERGGEAIKGAGVGAGVSALVPGVIAGTRAVKRILPGATNGLKASNKAAQRGAEALGLDKANSEIYREFLDDPSLYEKGRNGREALRKNPEQFRDTAQNLIDSIQDENSSIQNVLRKDAAERNLRDPRYGDSLDDMRSILGREANDAQLAGTSATYREGLNDALRAIEGTDLESVRAARGLGMEPGRPWRLNDNARNASPVGEAARSEGNRLWMGRKLLDDKLKALENKTGNKASQEYVELLRLRQRLDDRLKNTFESSPLYRTADATHSEVADVTSELGSLFNAPGKDVKSSGALRLFKNSAGDETAVRLNEVTRKTGELADGRLMSSSSVKDALSEFQKALEGPQAAGKLAKLSGATGLTTGRTTIPLLIGGAASLAGAPAGIGAAVLPATNPAVYLAIINAANRGEEKAVKVAERLASHPVVGPAFKNLRDAIVRTTAAGVSAD